jgi:hypothetical protein
MSVAWSAKRASAGILVTTSGYGKASFDFAEGKPIEVVRVLRTYDDGT